MSGKTRITIALICVTGLILGTVALAQAASLVGIAQVTPESAEEIALTQVSGGTVTGIELEQERGWLVYEVKIKRDRQHEVKIDAATGAIIGTSPWQTSILPQMPSVSLVQAARVTFARAEEIALAEVGGGMVTKIELEHERGWLVYEVEIRHGRKFEVKIDAMADELPAQPNQPIQPSLSGPSGDDHSGSGGCNTTSANAGVGMLIMFSALWSGKRFGRKREDRP